MKRPKKDDGGVSKTSFNVPTSLLRKFGSECKLRGDSQTEIVIESMKAYAAGRSPVGEPYEARKGFTIPAQLMPVIEWFVVFFDQSLPASGEALKQSILTLAEESRTKSQAKSVKTLTASGTKKVAG